MRSDIINSTTGQPFRTVCDRVKRRKVNVQGLARQEKILMGGLKPNPGNIIYSMDYVSLEPAITTHYTGDSMYRYATFDGIGKAPYWNNGVLMIDDIYLMLASTNPCTSHVMREAFDKDWGGLSFVEQWLQNSEVIKSALKKTARGFNKTACLGFGYGMGAKTFHKNATEGGHNISMQDAKNTFNSFWGLFSGVKEFADLMSFRCEQKGSLVNEFGYRLTPEPRKAYNAWIQSSASGVLDLLDMNVKVACPWAHLHSYIHDELLYEIPEDKYDLMVSGVQACVENVNRTLDWTLDLRIGESYGRSWFEAK